MSSPKPTREQANREYAQLLRMQERLLGQLMRIRDELVAPVTEELSCARSATARAPPPLRPLQT